LQSAIAKKWQPDRKRSSPAFRAWFDKAYQKGLVIASERQGDGIVVLTADERWLPFDELRQHSWEELTTMLRPSAAPRPVDVVPTPPETPPGMDGAAMLERYRVLWKTGISSQQAVRRSIAKHPEWNLEIGPDGPRLKLDPTEAAPEVSTTPEMSEVSTTPEVPAVPDPDGQIEPSELKASVLDCLRDCFASQLPIPDFLEALAERWNVNIPAQRQAWELAMCQRE
ncbi:MAG: hypothetical protein AAGA83_10580, partial [Cyanobacteria bacterium P01_F01_bin.116]